MDTGGESERIEAEGRMASDQKVWAESFGGVCPHSVLNIIGPGDMVVNEGCIMVTDASCSIKCLANETATRHRMWRHMKL
jgi:hypothetical protein